MTIWLNVDKPHRTGTLHIGECEDVRNRDCAQFKPTVPSIDRLARDGGWIRFDNRTEALAALDAYRAQRRQNPRIKFPDIEQKECGQCLLMGPPIPPVLEHRGQSVEWRVPVRVARLPPIAEIATRLNARAAARAEASPNRMCFGRLRDLRRRLKPKTTYRKAHDPMTVPKQRHADRSWTHHFGGGTELQFNIGFVRTETELGLRYGVAFSFETSTYVHDPGVDVLPLIPHFNDRVRSPDAPVGDLLMWSEFELHRSDVRPAGPVRPEECQLGVFVFVGRVGPAEPSDADLDEMIDLFDRLLPLYETVMRKGLADEPPLPQGPDASSPTQRVPSGRARTQLERTARTIDIHLRHNVLQRALHKQLVSEHGVDAVDFEQSVASGGRYDHRVRHPDGSHSFYEIKTAATAGGCLREAIGQLLEYAYWADQVPVDRLVVVGDVPIRAEEGEYLERLRARFDLPLDYLCLAGARL